MSITRWGAKGQPGAKLILTGSGFNGTFYLIGHCHLRGELRTFALDRIKMLHLTKESFEVPEEFNLEEFLKPGFGVITGEPARTRVWFDAAIAGYIKEKIWHESQEIHPQDDGSIIFEVYVAVTDEIKSWIMGWGAKAEVLEPESLREEIREEVEGMQDGYGKGVRREGKPVTA